MYSLIKLDQFTRSVFFSYKFLLVLKTSTFVNEKKFQVVLQNNAAYEACIVLAPAFHVKAFS